MKKPTNVKQLSLAVLMATTFTLVGCEDADNAKQAETTQAEPAKVAAAPVVEEKKVAFDLAKAADNAQVRYEAQPQVSKALYGAMFSHLHPLVQFDFSASDYARQDNGATAKSTAKIVVAGETIDEPRDFVLETVSHDTISYSEALWNEGVEARVESKFQIADALIKALDIDAAQEKEAVELLQKFETASSARFDLLKDKNVHSQFEIGEVEIAENGQKLLFKGFKGEGKYNEDGVLALLGSGEYSYDFKGLALAEADATQFEVKPFNVEYSLSKDGDFALKGSALELDVPVENNNFKVGSIVGEGKFSQYDTLAGTYLGASSISLKDIEVKVPEFGGQSYNFGSAHVSSHANLNGGLYAMGGKLVFDINDKTIKALAPEAPANVEYKQASVSFDLTNMSQELVKIMQDISADSERFADLSNEESVRLVADLFESVIQNRSVFQGNLNFDTSVGKINADVKVQAVEGASFDKAAFIEQAKAGTFDNQKLAQLFTFDALVTADQKLLDDTGASMMLMMMGGEFVELKDGQYIAHAEFKDGKLTINGKEVPMN